MTSPLEVVLVARREQSLWAGLIRSTLMLLMAGLLGGFALMLLLPLASDTFRWSRVAPGYWPCVALIVLTRVTVHDAVGRFLPTASGGSRG
jgi:hypothetical protein